MTVLSRTTKSRAGARAAKAIVTRPRLLIAGARAAPPAGKFALEAARPHLKGRARRGSEQIAGATRSAGRAIAGYAARAAYDLGLAEAPKTKRTAPRVAAGMVIGASAVYFLEPSQGAKHRKKVAKLVG
jgi:hypothetical protein